MSANCIEGSFNLRFQPICQLNRQLVLRLFAIILHESQQAPSRTQVRELLDFLTLVSSFDGSGWRPVMVSYS
jgi:hypothetical protein